MYICGLLQDNGLTLTCKEKATSSIYIAMGVRYTKDKVL